MVRIPQATIVNFGKCLYANDVNMRSCPCYINDVSVYFKRVHSSLCFHNRFSRISHKNISRNLILER